MRQFTIAAAALIAALSLSPTKAHAQAPPPPPAPPVIIPMHAMHIPWYVFACPVSIMFSAAVAATRDDRELTNWEAYTCGLLYWIGKPPKQYIRKIHHSELLMPESRRVG
jgi:hypothetical protein